MTAVRGSHRRPAGRRPAGDRGITLIEVIVSMTIMSIFLAGFSTGIATMYRAATKTDSGSAAQSEVNRAFLRLDKEIRYAAGISTPGTVGADSYVEYLTTNSGTPVCAELRLSASTRQLQRRIWTQGASPLAPTAWLPLASAVTATQPFTLSLADATYNFQRLRLRLVASSGSSDTASTKQSEITFTALNTSLSTQSGSVCTEGRSVP